MNRPSTIIEDRLAASGLAAEDVASRAALVARVGRALWEAAGRDAVWAWFVPGRIEIFGKHTDYAGGRSLLAAVPRGFAVAAAPRDDGRVRVIDARYGGSIDLDPQDEDRVFEGWTRYVAVVARRLAKNFPGAALGADIAIASDLPRAAGVSSSSALVVGLAAAMAERGRLAERPEWQAAIRRVEDLAGYLGAAENGLTFGSLAGTSGVGTHGGSEDHTAILACRAGRVSQYSYVPVVHRGDEVWPDGWRFIVASSGIEADKAGSARERYNRASLQTRALVEVWRTRHGRRATLADVLASGPEARAELEDLVAHQTHADYPADALARRLAHFIAEDARVPLAAQAIGRADAKATGILAHESQDQADRWLGNQIAETRVLAATALEAGAFAASSFGAGFGGSVWAIAPADDAGAIAASWVAAYRARAAHVAHVESFVARPGPGLLKLTES